MTKGQLSSQGRKVVADIVSQELGLFANLTPALRNRVEIMQRALAEIHQEESAIAFSDLTEYDRKVLSDLLTDFNKDFEAVLLRSGVDLDVVHLLSVQGQNLVKSLLRS